MLPLKSHLVIIKLSVMCLIVYDQVWQIANTHSSYQRKWLTLTPNGWIVCMRERECMFVYLYTLFFAFVFGPQSVYQRANFIHFVIDFNNMTATQRSKKIEWVWWTCNKRVWSMCVCICEHHTEQKKHTVLSTWQSDDLLFM